MRAPCGPASTRPVAFDWVVGPIRSLARLAGLPAVSMLSLRGNAFNDYHLPTDLPGRVDWDSVERCLVIAEAAARGWERPRGLAPRRPCAAGPARRQRPANSGGRFSKNAFAPSAKSSLAASAS